LTQSVGQASAIIESKGGECFAPTEFLLEWHIH